MGDRWIPTPDRYATKHEALDAMAALQKLHRNTRFAVIRKARAWKIMYQPKD